MKWQPCQAACRRLLCPPHNNAVQCTSTRSIHPSCLSLLNNIPLFVYTIISPPLPTPSEDGPVPGRRPGTPPSAIVNAKQSVNCPKTPSRTAAVVKSSYTGPSLKRHYGPRRKLEGSSTALFPCGMLGEQRQCHGPARSRTLATATPASLAALIEPFVE